MASEEALGELLQLAAKLSSAQGQSRALHLERFVAAAAKAYELNAAFERTPAALAHFLSLLKSILLSAPSPSLSVDTLVSKISLIQSSLEADSGPQSKYDGEAALVAEVLFALQGVDGVKLRFDDDEKRIEINDESMSAPQRALVLAVCATGVLYRRCCAYTANAFDRWRQSRLSLIEQGFKAGVEAELRGYYRALAQLEAQFRAEPALVSLRRLMLVIRPHFKTLSHITTLVDEFVLDMEREGHTAAVLFAMLERLGQHGDPDLIALAQRLATAATRPLLQMVVKWVFEGVIADPFAEFFIAENSDVVDPSELWTKRFTLSSNAAPSFIDESLKRIILRAGTSINLMRRSGFDLAPIESAARPLLAAAEAELFPPLAATPSASSAPLLLDGKVIKHALMPMVQLLDSTLLEFLNGKAQLVDHLKALKSYILLSNGEFSQGLVTSLEKELDRPSAMNPRHVVANLVDAALRNAIGYRPHTAAHVHLLWPSKDESDKYKKTPEQSPVGWNVFGLEYKVEAPLSVVLTSDVQRLYAQIFQFYWKIIRVEHLLTKLWSIYSSNRKDLATIAELQPLMKRSLLLRREMSHVVYNLRAYVITSVLERSWVKFEHKLKSAQNIDEVISLHSSYVSEMSYRLLLSERFELRKRALDAALETIVRFYREQTMVISAALEVIELRSHKQVQDEFTFDENYFNNDGDEETVKEATGDIAMTSEEEMAFKGRCLGDYLDEYNLTFRDFRESLLDTELVVSEGRAAIEDEDYLEELSACIDFNGYYRSH